MTTIASRDTSLTGAGQGERSGAEYPLQQYSSLTLKVNNFDEFDNSVIRFWTFLCHGGANCEKVFGHFDTNYKLMFDGNIVIYLCDTGQLVFCSWQ